jgi:hypothetical protein
MNKDSRERVKTKTKGNVSLFKSSLLYISQIHIDFTAQRIFPRLDKLKYLMILVFHFIFKQSK